MLPAPDCNSRLNSQASTLTKILRGLYADAVMAHGILLKTLIGQYRAGQPDSWFSADGHVINPISTMPGQVLPEHWSVGYCDPGKFVALARPILI